MFIVIGQIRERVPGIVMQLFILKIRNRNQYVVMRHIFG